MTPPCRENHVAGPCHAPVLAVVRLLFLFAAVATGSMLGARMTGTSAGAAIRFLPITILPGLAFILPRIWATRRMVRVFLHIMLLLLLVAWKGWHIHTTYADVIPLAAAIRLFAGSIAGVAALSILVSACMPRFTWLRATVIALLALLVDILVRGMLRPYTWHEGAGPLILAEILFFVIMTVGLMAGEWLETHTGRDRQAPDASLHHTP
ncbi:MAG: hypothetical protein A2498_04460 [Lentisphaerae bacterium RIFOXYC12_FULL_60_16]|nr:MAG: hypothetical protein A2498_04460 [Lentisphaerae bacterium RIFOXYC12_FULL_60_16]